jgi:hypothetical protein
MLKADAEAIAIAPSMRSCTRLYGTKVRQLGSIHNPHAQRFDFIIAHRPKEACRAIWNHFLDDAEPWDVLKLCRPGGGLRTLDELPRIAARDPSSSASGDPRPHTCRCAAPGSEAISRLSRKFRNGRHQR